ncbi:MAG: MFS transporter [Nitrospinota bacterium]|nr:MAG: MFS transporter [Nitrospinota bacterium]
MSHSHVSERGMPHPKPARFFYGWVIVGLVFLNIACSFGLWFSFSVFFVAILEEFGRGRGVTAGIFAVGTFIFGLTSLLIGRIVDRIGPSRVLALGSLVLALSFVLISQSTRFWQLYLFFGLFTATGSSALGWVPHATILSAWFVKKRGTFLGIAYAGMGIGILTLSPLIQYLISLWGWRMTYLFLAGVIALVLFPLNFFFQIDTPAQKGTYPDNQPPERRAERKPVPAPRQRIHGTPRLQDWTLREALRGRQLWLLFLANIFIPLGVFPVSTHQIAYVVDLGYDKLLAASIFGLLGIWSTIGRILFGIISDRIGRVNAITLSFITSAIGIVLLLLLRDNTQVWLLYIYAFFFGLGFGARGPILSAIAADLFQGSNFAVIFGFISLGWGIGGALGPWFAGFVYDLMGSYTLAFLAAILFLGCSCLCFWLAVPRRARQG